METNAGRRPLRPALTTLGVLVSLAVVGVAARGSIPTADDGGGRPADTLVDILFTLYLVVLAAGAVFFVYLLVLQRGLKRKTGSASSPFSLLVPFVILLVGLFLARRLADLERRPPPEETLVPRQPPPRTSATIPEDAASDPGFAWLPALAFATLLVLAAGAVFWGGARRRRALAEPDAPGLQEALADVLEATLDDLRAERDPRRAVIAAYARLERVLAAHGIPRRPSDAPLEYLRRVLHDLSVNPDAVQRLTLLFERAKFSHHAVGPDMKDEAIAALETMQDELRVAEALAQQERERAARLTIERARSGR